MRNIFISTALVICSLALQAQDRQFVRTYQSLNLAKGTRDIEVWSTLRTGKEAFYRRLDERLEFELGLTDRLQTALYLNASHISYANKGDSTGTIFSESEFSLSSEWKFKLSDPSTNALGSALYGEFTLGGKELELEAKIILDKKINNHLIALNLVGEWEWEQEVEATVVNGEVEQENKMELEATPMEIDLAYMYNIRPNIGLGLEAKNHYEVTPSGGLEHSALFAGPTLYWSTKDNKHCIIFNFLPQLANMYKSSSTPDALDLDEYEKYDFRLLIDFTF